MRKAKVLFKDVVEFPPKVNLEKGEMYDFIPMEAIDSGVKYVSELQTKRYDGGGTKFRNGDTLFARITPCLENNKIAKVKDLEKSIGFGSTEYFVFRAKEHISDSDYIYYLAKSDLIRQPAIKSMVGASGRQRADKGVVENIELTIPDLPIQQKIGSILSAYDDLIENNNKRIKLLEETGQNIYKEWFVHFRFPGFEKAKFENGLPKGWRKENLYDLVEVQMGFSFKGDTFNDGSVGQPVIRIRDIPNQWTNTYSTEEAPDSYIVERGDILIGMDGFFYLDIWAGQRAYLVQRVCRMRSFNTKMQGYVLEALREPIKYYESTIMGATVAHLGAKHLKEINITVPDTKYEDLYTVFGVINQQKLNLLEQNQKLKEARDILLPRLMNGEIEVEATIHELEEA